MEHVLNRLAETFSPERIGAGIADVLPDLITATVIFATFYVLWKVLRRVARTAARTSDLDETAASFIEAILKYSILTIGVISALNQAGVNTTSVLTSLGVLGLTIGFAARDALSNIISGIFIFWDRPFVIGDLVEIDDYYGRVQEITMRSTRVVTPDGRMLAIPNSTVVNSTVASYTNFPHLRIDIPVTVGVGEDLARVERLLLELCAAESACMKDPAPVVAATALNDYNVGLELRVWIHDEREHVALRSRLRRGVFETLREAGVDMPYETLQLQPILLEQAA